MYDLAVIGGGPGGYVAAICGAQRGFKTVLIEKDELGGTCLNRGCTPTKCFVNDAKLFFTAKNSGLLKGNETISLDAQKMVSRKKAVVKTLIGGLSSLMKSHGIEVVQGLGEMVAPGSVRTTLRDGSVKESRATHVVLAMGSKPAALPFIQVDGKLIQTTDQALDFEEVPRSIVVIGGGVIGVEMASIYLNLGCEATILELLPDILAGEDAEVRQLMRALMERRGARILLGARATGVAVAGKRVEVAFQDGAGKAETIKAERLLVATGRVPVLDGVQPERLGLAMNGPFVKVNGRLETNLPGVYAIGDLVGGMMLAHKASAEAEAAVANIAGEKREIAPSRVPRCIWGLTEIGAVGLSESEAKAGGRRVKVGKFPLSYSAAAQSMGKGDGLVKIVGDADTGEILGVHIIGEQATNLIGESVLAMTMESAVEDLAEVIKPHPTLTENIMEAARDWSDAAIHVPKKRRQS